MNRSNDDDDKTSFQSDPSANMNPSGFARGSGRPSWQPCRDGSGSNMPPPSDLELLVRNSLSSFQSLSTPQLTDRQVVHAQLERLSQHRQPRESLVSERLRAALGGAGIGATSTLPHPLTSVSARDYAALLPPTGSHTSSSLMPSQSAIMRQNTNLACASTSSSQGLEDLLRNLGQHPSSALANAIQLSEQRHSSSLAEALQMADQSFFEAALLRASPRLSVGTSNMLNGTIQPFQRDASVTDHVSRLLPGSFSLFQRPEQQRNFCEKEQPEERGRDAKKPRLILKGGTFPLPSLRDHKAKDPCGKLESFSKAWKKIAKSKMQAELFRRRLGQGKVPISSETRSMILQARRRIESFHTSGQKRG